MTFEEKIRGKIASVVKDPSKTQERDVYRVVLGEAQLEKSPPTEERGVSIVRGLIEANNQTLAVLGPADARHAKLTGDNLILSGLLPAYLTADQIRGELERAGVVAGLRASAKEGQAVGLAVKTLKAGGFPAEGAVVTTVVKELRA